MFPVSIFADKINIREGTMNIFKK